MFFKSENDIHIFYEKLCNYFYGLNNDISSKICLKIHSNATVLKGVNFGIIILIKELKIEESSLALLSLLSCDDTVFLSSGGWSNKVPSWEAESSPLCQFCWHLDFWTSQPLEPWKIIFIVYTLSCLRYFVIVSQIN